MDALVYFTISCSNISRMPPCILPPIDFRESVAPEINCGRTVVWTGSEISFDVLLSRRPVNRRSPTWVSSLKEETLFRERGFVGFDGDKLWLSDKLAKLLLQMDSRHVLTAKLLSCHTSRSVTIRVSHSQRSTDHERNFRGPSCALARTAR